MSQLGRNNYGGKLTKGTTGDRDTISSPSSGDLHYNTNTNQMNIFVDGNWKLLNLTIPSNQVALLSGSTPPTPPEVTLAGAGGLNGTSGINGDATGTSFQLMYPAAGTYLAATRAFNGTLSDGTDYWQSDDNNDNISSSNTKSIFFEFPYDVVVSKYRIWSRSNSSFPYNPKDWKLYAYQHQSSTAVEIDTQTGESNWYTTTSNSITNNIDYNEYTTTNTNTYRKYELRISGTNDSNNKVVGIGELAFYGPGNANNNNVFYKNTNPYNLQVYRNAWKTLPLQLTNEPSFSYGTTIPSNSSGNTGNVFYNTTNNTLNLRRNSEWISIFSRIIRAAGGIETTYSNYKVHSFVNVGTHTFTVLNNSITVDILIVGGGGGGYPGGSGAWEGGGGGAGELIYRTNLIMSVGVYTIFVGGGGGSGSMGSSTGITGQGLNNNYGYIANGGGRGSRGSMYATSGGSGGGSGHQSSNSSRVGSARTGTYGVYQQVDSGDPGDPDRKRLDSSTSAVNQVGNFAYSGGYKNSSYNIAGGGGGAGGHGALGTDTSPGGIGKQYNIRTGIAEWYAGGGGGGARTGTSVPGGNGGGGYGGSVVGSPTYAVAAGGDGDANTGGGGGGSVSSYNSNNGGTGGSGIVVIRYVG